MLPPSRPVAQSPSRPTPTVGVGRQSLDQPPGLVQRSWERGSADADADGPGEGDLGAIVQREAPETV